MSFDTLPAPELIGRTAEALRTRNVTVLLKANRVEALQALRDLLPAGSELMTGASRTLEEIGFVELLKSRQHPWNNLKDGLLSEPDPARQATLRRQYTLARYFLSSVHAITESGQVAVASATGSQLPSIAYSSPNVIWVVGAQKIVMTLEDAFKRIREYCLPLEDKRMKSVGLSGSTIAKVLVFERETSSNRRMTMILVNEKLGF